MKLIEKIIEKIIGVPPKSPVLEEAALNPIPNDITAISVFSQNAINQQYVNKENAKKQNEYNRKLSVYDIKKKSLIATITVVSTIITTAIITFLFSIAKPIVKDFIKEISTIEIVETSADSAIE